MPMTAIENEMRVGAMIRTMSGDVRDTMKEQVYELYTDEAGKLEGYREGCARWHWMLLVYCEDAEVAKKYIAMIQMYFIKKEDPDKDENWKQLMRIIMPIQFIKKIDRFTQVPRLAIMDQTPLRYKTPQQKRKPMFSDITW